MLNLTEEKYAIEEMELNLTGEVTNVIGLDKLDEFVSNQEVTDIESVFDNLQKTNPRIIILETARKSARKHDFKNEFQLLYRSMLILAELELNSRMSAEEKQDQFKQRTTNEISPESSKTLRVPKFRKEREFVVPTLGKKLFDWHVKIGQSTRVHYFVDADEKYLYIGHCGRHLGTANYNS